MATSLDSLIGFANLLGQVRGQSQTQTRTGGTTTQTSQTELDQAAIDRMIQQMMGGQGGQASISGAARSAGLYDSTTERQMLNDLNARVSGEVAQRSAPTTTTTERDPEVTTTEVPGMGLGSMGTALGIASVAKPLIEGGMSQLSGEGSMLSRVFGGGGGGGSGIDLGTISAGPGLTSSLGDTVGQGLSGILGSLGGVSQAAGTGGSLLSSGLGSLGDFASTSFSSSLAPSAAGSAMSGATGSLGPIFSALNGENQNLFSFGSSALAPMLASMGPVGAVAAAVLPILTSFIGGSVVCTALAKRGLLDKKLYAAGSDYINTVPTRALNGYYLWGKPLARQIDKGNRIAIALSLPFARQRTALLAGSPAWRNPLGLATKYIGEPLCYAIGYVMEKSNGLSYTS